MDKKEVEKAKEHYIFTTKHELDNENKMLKKYIEHLKQKTETLDKVTDKLKEDAEIFKKENVDGALQNYVAKILKIIEGEKK